MMTMPKATRSTGTTTRRATGIVTSKASRARPDAGERL
jgi:hypothetical protein